MIKHLLFWVLLCSGGYYYWLSRPVTHGPGVVAPESPVQKNIYIEDFGYKSYNISPKAEISFEARVLSIQTYYFDSFTDLTSTDIVFGWGPMSDESNLSSILIRQSDRTYDWEMTKPPIPQQKMRRHIANMHLIGSTRFIRDKISAIRKGQIVNIEGYLVNVESPSGWTLKTSLERGDIGEGSSELVWIKSLSIL